MVEWIRQAEKLLKSEGRCALVTILKVSGSSPREAGARMLVSGKKLFGTIGGGQLEYTATHEARALLGTDTHYQCVRTYSLGPELGQCCGGRVTVSFETLNARNLNWVREASDLVAQGSNACIVRSFSTNANGQRWLVRGNWQDRKEPLPEKVKSLVRMNTSRHSFIHNHNEDTWYQVEPLVDPRTNLWIFGAGHVGTAIVNAANHLSFRITWIDSRPDIFPPSFPSNTTILTPRSPEAVVEKAPSDTFYLVMTHSHSLDQELCRHILLRGDFGYLGLIGSATKKSRFKRQWRAQGISASVIERLTCPIGIAELTGKQPGELAIATLAQLVLQIQVAKSSIAAPLSECR